MDDLKSKIEKYETLFSGNGYNGLEKRSFVIKEGRIPILISCTHSVNQIREGHMKSAELYTGAISILLYQTTGCHLFCKTRNNADDANFDTRSDYKDELVKYVRDHKIKLVLDIHGSMRDREFDIDIGTNYGSNVYDERTIDLLADTLVAHGMKKTFIDRKFKATRPTTVSNTVSQSTGVPCLQVEINRNFRDIDKMDCMQNLIEGLVDFIEQYTK